MYDDFPNLREHLINAALDFVERAKSVSGIVEIGLIGSITTDKPKPKDIDVLVTVKKSADFVKLAEIGRKLKGKGQQLNSGADIFIINEKKKYLGRTCHWKDCRPFIRMACKAQNCGKIPHLNDDFQIFRLRQEFIENVPIILFPKVIICQKLPKDLTEIIEQRFTEITKYR